MPESPLTRVLLFQARQGMSQHSNMYSGQVQQHGQSSYYSSTQSPSSAMQQVGWGGRWDVGGGESGRISWC